MLRTSELDYDLPTRAIALAPADPRDAARLMLVKRSDPGYMVHARVRDLPEVLSPGDLMVVNTTRVIQARFEGVRADTGGRVEGLYLGAGPVVEDRRTWHVLLQGKRMREGVAVALLDRADGDAKLALRLISRDEREAGSWLVGLERWEDGKGEPLRVGDTADPDVLEVVGRTPLPPYIVRARKQADEQPSIDDRVRYQTVFAQPAEADGDGSKARPVSGLHTAAGSVAAPTAGLHFTPELLERLASMGVHREEVTLHVGLGTFKSVESEFVEEHRMHSERCRMPARVRDAVARTRAEGGRVLCVGTTAARTVESYARLAADERTDDWLDTNLLITPGYRWRWTDAMVTNFHLPRSTLMAMIASLLGDTPNERGVDRLKRYYQTALAEGYRFYSYGDAMCVLE